MSAQHGRALQGSVVLQDDPSNTIHILVVEDNPVALLALTALIESIASDAADFGLPRLNLAVRGCATAEQAWSLLSTGCFVLAFVDVSLGSSMSGLELSKHLVAASSAAASGREDPLLIACTGDHIDAETAAAHGMADVLRKPVSKARLRHTLHKWLPRHRLGAAVVPPPRGGSGGVVARLLQVEDCEVSALAVQCHFEELGFLVQTVASGEEAMELLSPDRGANGASYDLILIDVNLAGEMSGYALCSWYRELCQREQVPAAAVVSVTADPDLATSREFGFDRCLPKPVTAAVAEELAKGWLGPNRSSAGASAAPQREYGSMDCLERRVVPRVD